MSINHNLTDIEYHAMTDWIGSTTAKHGLASRRLLGDAITGQYQLGDKPAFAFGRLFHRLILQPETLNISPCAPPELVNPRTGQPYGVDTKKWSDWQAANPNAVILEPWMQTMRERMPDEVAWLIQKPRAVIESSVFQTTRGVRMKARPDVWLPERNAIYDLKSIRQVDGDFDKAIDREIANRAYWFSAAWYRRVIELETGAPHTFSLIFAEKGHPYRWRIVDLDRDYYLHGDDEVTRVLAMIDVGMSIGEWDDLEDTRRTAYPPAWLIPAAEPIENEDGGIDLL